METPATAPVVSAAGARAGAGAGSGAGALTPVAAFWTGEAASASPVHFGRLFPC